MKKLIIIPAYNEAGNLPGLIEEIRATVPTYDYVIVNDGSSDNTASICRQLGLNVLDLPLNLGIGGAVQAGYRYAKYHNYDIAIQLDGDGQHDPSYLDKLIQPIIDNSSDFVIGSRYIDKRGFQSTRLRRFGISWLNSIIRLLTSEQITDCTSGFRAANSTVIDMFVAYYPFDYPEPETIVDVHRSGFRIQEVPVLMRDRIHGTSSIKMLKSVYYMVKVSIALIVSYLKRR